MPEIRFGVVLAAQHPPNQPPLKAVEEDLALADFACESGWDSLWVGQHHLPESLAQLQTLPLLGRLTAQARDLSVGTSILLVALTNPVEVAESIATLDILSGGRLIVGLGLGYRDVEFEAYGVPRSERIQRFEENVTIVRRLLEGDAVTVERPWCRLREARLRPRPVQRPRPPIWIAANSDRAVCRAARLGDAWLVSPHVRVETVERQVSLFTAERDRLGLPHAAFPMMREILCAPTRDLAWKHAELYLDANYSRYRQWGQDRVLPVGETFAGSFDDLAAERFIIGSPDDCLRALLALIARVPVEHFIFRTHWSGLPLAVAEQSMKLLGREVFPLLRERQGGRR